MKPNLFLSPRRTKSGYREAVAWIKAETRSALRLDDDTTVSVSELSCSDPGCPDVETVIAVFRPDRKPQISRVHKTITEVTSTDLSNAIDALRFPAPD
ncbi:hypothetical protein [Tardiphaga robiniae]|uniref:Nitrate reductase n=1 Tax=Tardiphaga robiniae TaxID=943830 RepID=A0A163X5Q6_9BRAD|nr:hypothetical protein [Tardiphaga robiniae]KZD20449.1 hypothetical protein A4A58_19695 [Tardiphaga robiniae]